MAASPEAKRKQQLRCVERTLIAVLAQLEEMHRPERNLGVCASLPLLGHRTMHATDKAIARTQRLAAEGCELSAAWMECTAEVREAVQRLNYTRPPYDRSKPISLFAATQAQGRGLKVPPGLRWKTIEDLRKIMAAKWESEQARDAESRVTVAKLMAEDKQVQRRQRLQTGARQAHQQRMHEEAKAAWYARRGIALPAN